MIKTSKLAIIALVAAVGIASPALAQYAGRNAYYSGRVNSDSPVLTGGGSQGSNERSHYDSQ